jgi:hypothetical protein
MLTIGLLPPSTLVADYPEQLRTAGDPWSPVIPVKVGPFLAGGDSNGSICAAVGFPILLARCCPLDASGSEQAELLLVRDR